MRRGRLRSIGDWAEVPTCLGHSDDKRCSQPYLRRDFPMKQKYILGPPEVRLRAKCLRVGDCWIWQGAKDAAGYGSFWFKRAVKAHVASYIIHVGPIPLGLELDHTCRNRACVNPKHLEPVTHRENVLRGQANAAINAKKTHCSRGHALIPENIYDSKNRADNRRVCIACKVIDSKNRKRKKHLPASI